MSKEELNVPDQGKVLKRVAKSMDEVNAGESDNLVELSSGVVLEVHQANPSMLIQIMTRERRPEPPTVLIEKANKYIENPDDPDYIARVKAWEMNYNSALLFALIGLGTKIHTKPKGMPGPESDEWIRDIETFGLKSFPESKAWRYTQWVLSVAAPLDTDTQKIGAAVRKLSGVKEADVRDATNFPEGDETGG